MRQVAWYSDNPVRFGNQLVMRKWMYEQFRQFGNVTLYDFQSTAGWTFNLDLYKDLSHHSGEVNSLIAEAIGTRNTDYLVTDKNIDGFNQLLEMQAQSAVIDSSGNLYQSSVLVNGQKIDFTVRLIQGNKELWLSAKDTAAALGATVTWDASAKTVILNNGDHRVVMTLGSTEALVNSSNSALEAAPLLVGGRALIPMAFTAEKLGWKVSTAKTDSWVRYSLTSGS
ncbi:hypothetical protein D3C75_768250 [compost metagenome]